MRVKRRTVLPRRVALERGGVGSTQAGVGSREDVAGDESFLVYTHSDPDAGYLADYLKERGFLSFGDDLSDSAMVLVVDTEKKKLLRAIGRSGLDYRDWEISRFGGHRGMVRSVKMALGRKL